MANVSAFPGSRRSSTLTVNGTPSAPSTVAVPVNVALVPLGSTTNVSNDVARSFVPAPLSLNERSPDGLPAAYSTSKPKFAVLPAEVPRRIRSSASSLSTRPPPLARPGVLTGTPDAAEVLAAREAVDVEAAAHVAGVDEALVLLGR